jgi:hypothetical protein
VKSSHPLYLLDVGERDDPQDGPLKASTENSERRALTVHRRVHMVHRLRERARVVRHGFPETLEMKGQR